MYHVVPQRVLSSRGGRDQAVSVALQQLNQTLCHRRTSLGRSIATSNPNNTISNSSSTTTTTNTNSSSNDAASNPTTTTATTADNNNNTSTNNTSGNDTGKSINTDNSASSRANDVKNASNVSLADPATKPADAGEPTEGKTTEGKTTVGKTTERGGRSPTDKPSARAALRGLMAMDVNEHSAEWLEESRLKQEESVAILSEQLKSMIVGSDLDQLSSSANRLSPEDLGTSQEALSLDLYRPEDLEEAKRGGEEGGGGGERGGGGRGGEGGGGGESRERSLCMKTMQCEVLGPYSCSDCTKIRLNEHQQREQTALYPGLAVDPRTLVAPDRLKRLTASLPPHLTSQRYRLDCGCALQMHPDFLFPVIVTDHDIQSRLKSLRSEVPPARAGTPVRVDSSEGDSGAGSLFARGGGRGSVGDKMEREALSFGDDEAEESAMSPTDMKVTVRYTTSSPEQKGVFITT